MSQTQLSVHTKLQIPVTIIHSPDMPAASKVSERPFTWPEVQQIINTNDLDVFARSRSQTEKYHAFKRELRSKGTTVYKHLLTGSLKWAKEDEIAGLPDSEIKVASSGDPIFTNADDLKIIKNDFPYFFEDNVAHLCVWTKQPIVSDKSTALGDISKETRSVIDKYVYKTFVEKAGIPRDNLVWFRNWEALQSVREISHIHVLIKDASNEQIEALIGTPGVPLER
ncbi:hypothetical protein OXX69_006863 [Metschnikowia pulcherrima]